MRARRRGLRHAEAQPVAHLGRGREDDPPAVPARRRQGRRLLVEEESVVEAGDASSACVGRRGTSPTPSRALARANRGHRPSARASASRRAHAEDEPALPQLREGEGRGRWRPGCVRRRCGCADRRRRPRAAPRGSGEGLDRAGVTSASGFRRRMYGARDAPPTLVGGAGEADVLGVRVTTASG